MAFSVFGNDSAYAFIRQRMIKENGMKFRDGLDYDHQLRAVRRVIDSMEPSQWEGSVNTLWLRTLRELSKPIAFDGMPQVFSSPQWR